MVNESQARRKIDCISVTVFFCFFLASNSIALAQDNSEIYDVLESAQEVLDSVIKEVTNDEYKLPYQLSSVDEFNKAFIDFQDVLGGGDLEAMAKWFPNANQLMTYVDATPGFEPYADWLRQRIDYAAIANEAVGTIPLTQPLPATSTVQSESKLSTSPTSKTQSENSASKPSASELNIPSSAVTQSNQRLAFARNPKTWSKKLAGRPTVLTAENLVPSLKKIFSAQGVPPELVWMAEVESTFNPAARSPAGAVGLFQLMPATAKHLGLQIEPEDQRLDPSKNGQAAAKYLKDLYDRFEDWPLAIAAYNGGEGRISKLLKANSARNLDAISDQLPSQTQMYVPKVLATIRHREGFDPSGSW